MSFNLISRLVREEEGAAAVEYAILVAVVAIAVAAALKLFNLNGIYTTVSSTVQNVVTNAAN